MVRHLLVALALLGVAVAGGVHYDAMYDEKWPYPTDEELSADYDEYVGEQVLLFGDVESVDRTADRATIEVEADDGPFAVTVEGIDADVDSDGVVQVYGTVRPGHTITASNVVVEGCDAELLGIVDVLERDTSVVIVVLEALDELADALVDDVVAEVDHEVVVTDELASACDGVREAERFALHDVRDVDAECRAVAEEVLYLVAALLTYRDSH